MALPTEHKSEKDIVEMISKSIHKELWNHRRQTKVEKSKIAQAWVDDYTLLIIPYIQAKKFKDDEVVRSLAYLIAGRLQKVRADKELDRKAETPKEHLMRTTEQVNQFRNHLQLPTDTTADIPDAYRGPYGTQ